MQHRDRPTGASLVETGSGDIQVDHAQAELRVKSGSGDVSVGHGGGAVAVSTGSGDVEIGTSQSAAVVKTGSGDLRVGESHDDVTLATGSGDFVIDHAHRGRLTAKGASGDVRVGIPAGLPVWTDLTHRVGEHPLLARGRRPAGRGQDHVELRAKTVSRRHRPHPDLSTTATPTTATQSGGLSVVTARLIHTTTQGARP